MFAVASAPEKYQQNIKDVLRCCESVVNIANDLIIHEIGVEEYDKRLYAILNRLWEVGLTLNGSKCKFDLFKLTSFGYEITSDGINQRDEKVARSWNREFPQGR